MERSNSGASRSAEVRIQTVDANWALSILSALNDRASPGSITLIRHRDLEPRWVLASLGIELAGLDMPCPTRRP